MNASQAIAESIRAGRARLQSLILAELDEVALLEEVKGQIRAAQDLDRAPSLNPSRASATGRGAGDLLAG